MQVVNDTGNRYRGVMLFSPYMTPNDINGLDSGLQELFGCDKGDIKDLDSKDAMTKVAESTTQQDITIVIGMEDDTISPDCGVVCTYLSSLITLNLTIARCYIAFSKAPIISRASSA